MEIPELVREHLGDEELRTGVRLGDEDVLVLTPTRTLLYRAEGLLSDESVTEFPHELERLEMSDGRRKTTFGFEYVEDDRSLTVPNDVSGDVLDLLLEGVLTVERILDDEEGVVGAFRFSELTLIVAENRIVKHVGNAVWEDDFEVFAYEDLTGLDFEKASVATEVVLGIDGRPQRIKTPNDKARLVERTVKQAVFEYFDVSTMSELRSHFGAETDGEDEEADAPDDLQFGDEIRPLGDDGGTDSTAETEPDSEVIADAEAERSSVSTADTDPSQAESGPAGPSNESSGSVTQSDLEVIDEQLSELTAAVNRQNELLRKQHAAIKQLIEELRQGR
jgi:hypothetical protein